MVIIWVILWWQYILPLDKKTGKPSETGFGRRVAMRPQSVDTAIEGGFIITIQKRIIIIYFVLMIL